MLILFDRVELSFKIGILLELVSKELNHLAAILHVYAGGMNFMKYKKKKMLLFFKKKMEILLHFLSFLWWKIFKTSKIAQIYYYDPQSAGITLQSPKSDSTLWTLILVIFLQKVHFL